MESRQTDLESRFDPSPPLKWESRIDSDFTTCGRGRGEGCNPGCLPVGVEGPSEPGKEEQADVLGEGGARLPDLKASSAVWTGPTSGGSRGGAWDVRACRQGSGHECLKPVVIGLAIGPMTEKPGGTSAQLDPGALIRSPICFFFPFFNFPKTLLKKKQ